jgi:DNA-binding protein HU-beta
MEEEKKTDPPLAAPDGTSPKPLVTQIIEAVIDGAADIAKAVAIGAVARAGQQVKKTEVGKAAVAIVKKAEGLPSKKKPKKAAAKKVAAKKTPAKKSKLPKKSIAKKAPAKATKRIAAKPKAASKKPRSR